MKFSQLILAVCCLLALEEALAESVPEDPKCDRAFNYAQRAFQLARQKAPEWIEKNKSGIKLVYGIDLDNLESLKPMLCKIVHVKSLKDLHALTPLMPYDQLVFMYKYVQKMVVNVGGYTNTERVVGMYHDALQWIVSLDVSDPSEIKTKHDLSEVEHFFNVMQVKYGSRWLSFPARADFEGILIEDPKTIAKDLYDCTSEMDFQRRTRMSPRYTAQLWKLWKGDKNDQILKIMKNDQITDFLVEGEALVGELGLYNLEY